MIYIPNPRRNDAFREGVRLGTQMKIAAQNRDLQRRRMEAEERYRRAQKTQNFAEKQAYFGGGDILDPFRPDIPVRQERQITITPEQERRATFTPEQREDEFYQQRLERFDAVRPEGPERFGVRRAEGGKVQTPLGVISDIPTADIRREQADEMSLAEWKDYRKKVGKVLGPSYQRDLEKFEKTAFGEADRQKRLQQRELTLRNQHNKLVKDVKSKRYLKGKNSSELYAQLTDGYQRELKAAGFSNPKRRKAFLKYKRGVIDVDNFFGNRTASGLRWSDVQYRPPARGRGRGRTGDIKLKTYHFNAFGDDLDFQVKSIHPVGSDDFISDVVRYNPRIQRKDLEENRKSIGLGKGKGPLTPRKRIERQIAIDLEKSNLLEKYRESDNKTAVEAEIRRRGYVLVGDEILTRKEAKAISPNIELSESFEDALERRGGTGIESAVESLLSNPRGEKRR